MSEVLFFVLGALIGFNLCVLLILMAVLNRWKGDHDGEYH